MWRSIDLDDDVERDEEACWFCRGRGRVIERRPWLPWLEIVECPYCQEVKKDESQEAED
jgi:hypothetical protein